ncbi:Protein CBG10693 [Caenorhabditis briggsae]|uniref:Protein CBG10693 n=1 Tax=Caenorhabditis briggsae TaxID=6238 RepID=A8XBK7_CAEBR|nr:Protein CBG10693 [Caenorhabditis briggsae]CAP30023.1 Protein CBG10693 [Caenorhabditis briggsae]
MSKCQRGFQEREGCNESIGILRSAIDVAKGQKKHLSVAWLDLTNAFGSVPHELIEGTLKAYGFPKIVVTIIRDMYNGATIRVKSKTYKIDQIHIKSGVKQGDPISSTWKSHPVIDVCPQESRFWRLLTIWRFWPTQKSNFNSVITRQGKPEPPRTTTKTQVIRQDHPPNPGQRNTTRMYPAANRKRRSRSRMSTNHNNDHVPSLNTQEALVNGQLNSKFVVKDDNLALMVQATDKSKIKTFEESQVERLQQLLKNETVAAQLHRFLTEKKVKSEVVEVILQHPASTKFVRSGGKVSLASHRFVHRARLNLLSCNYNTYDKTLTKACRRCGYPSESQWHILQSCTFGLAKNITARHDAVLHKIKSLVEVGDKKDWTMQIDQEIPGFTQLRPDIFLESPDEKKVLVADVACPYEHGKRAMEENWNTKLDKYQKGFQHLTEQGIEVTVLPIVISSLGTWWSPTSDSLTALGIPKSTIRNIIPELCSTVLEQQEYILEPHTWRKIHQHTDSLRPNGHQWKKERTKPSNPATE